MPYRRTAAVQARLDDRRDALVHAARAVIAEHGYAGCSIAAVAHRAGVATGTVYRYFPDKAALSTEVFRVSTEAEVAAVRTAAATAPVADVAGRIAAMVRTFAYRALRAPRIAYALIAEPVELAVETERLRYRAAYREVFTEVIRDGVDRGELPEQHPATSAAAVVGALAEALVVPLHDPADRSPADRDVLVDHLTDLILRALGASR